MNFRQALWLIAKLVFASLVVGWLLKKANAKEIWSYLESAQAVPIFAGLFLGVLMILIASWRWLKLLGVFGIHIRWRELFCINWVGQFFMMFLPGPTGDDLTRMLYISRLAKGRVALACSTVLIDRCIGLASVFFLSLFCLPLQWPLLAANVQTRWLALIIIAGAAAVVVAGVLFLFAAKREGGLVFGLVRFLPVGKLRSTLEESWSSLCGNKFVLFQVFAAAVITQLLNCAAFYCAGLAVGVSATFSHWCSFVPVVLAANILPVTIAGIGVREYLLVLFLGVLASTTTEQALAASAVAFGMMLLVSLAGGCVYLFYRPKVA